MKTNPSKPLAVRLTVAIVGGLFVALVLFAVLGFVMGRLTESASALKQITALIASILLALLGGWTSFRASMKR
jgi:ABC-type nickel/cobalt efflux system permease component RcnA